MLSLILVAANPAAAAELLPALELHGLTITPHVQSVAMRYRQPTPSEPGLLAQVFLRNTSPDAVWLDDSLPIRVSERSPAQLLASGEWTWHDTLAAWPGRKLRLPPGALTVWSFNARGTNWQLGTRVPLSIGARDKPLQTDCTLAFDAPRVWLSAVTFVGPTNSVQPDSVICHVANESDTPLRLQSCRLWLPASNDSWQALMPREAVTNLECFPADGVIPAKDRGGARIRTGPLPLTYAAVEVQLTDASGKPITLWSHLRVKREVFDISGGWVASKLDMSNTLQCAPYLKTLRRMHINTGHIADTAATPTKPDQTDSTRATR